MTVKDLKEIISQFPENAEVFMVGWNGQKTVKRYGQRCCNIEHQEKVNEFWLSTEGLIVN